jgi:predicted AAA+ superfamily ATPase
MDGISVEDFYNSYLLTYVERDVRQIKNIADRGKFQNFLKLLAGRVGQFLNLNSLSIELGLSNKTIDSRISVLETSFIAYRLLPYLENYSKRIIKSPKIYFYDTGLLSFLFGIKSESGLSQHYAKGLLFENLVINELMKHEISKGKKPEFYFWRDVAQHEVDLIIKVGVLTKAIEIKAGKTIQADFLKNLSYFKNLDTKAELHLIYGGNGNQKRTEFQVWDFENHQRALSSN